MIEEAGGPVELEVTKNKETYTVRMISNVRCDINQFYAEEDKWWFYAEEDGWWKYARLPQKPEHPMTPLEAFEFLAEGHEGKPRVWRDKEQDDRWFPVGYYPAGYWDSSQRIDTARYANLSDRDGETLIWREFPMVEDKT